MSEKQFNHIEDRIREAAENSEPAFDMNAWIKMEARLDEEDKRKRRYFIWWLILPFLFIVGGGIYLLGNKKSTDKIIAAQKINEKTIVEKNILQKNIPSVTPAITSILKFGDDGTNLQSQPVTPIPDPSKQIDKGIQTAQDIFSGAPQKIMHTKKGKLSSNSSMGLASNPYEEIVDADSAGIVLATSTIDKVTEKNLSPGINDTIIKKDSSKNAIDKNLGDKTNTPKLKGVKPSRFYFTASFGADAAAVKLLSFHNSKTTANYGMGIGYQLTKKISVQTGFYVGRKKYIAGPDDYKTKPNSYWRTVQIIKVDASCLVYDIPLTLRYTILQKPTTSYFAMAGISSYIMKKEDYNYFYLRNNMPHESAKTYTGNRNIFSVFNLSAGIEKKLSPNFYIQAIPSVSIPLSGVGDGSVKLYSTALQVGIKYQPVTRHK
jgi:hypothetical protein